MRKSTATDTGIGRPPKGKDRRDRRVNVSFSPEEYKRVEKARKRISEDITLTAFVRRCALSVSEELV